MKQYIRYEIQKRKYSSNIILGVYLKYNEKEKKWEEEKDKLVAPLISKKEGDILAVLLLTHLNTI